MRLNRFCIGLLCMSLSFSAVAVNAKKGEQQKNAGVDYQFQVFDYHPNETTYHVIKAKIGQFTEIQFSPEEGREKILYGLGDKSAWTIFQHENTLIFKPSAAFPSTNMKVKTNKRVYWFKLQMAQNEKEVLWHAEFRYPDEPVVLEPIVPVVPPPSPEMLAAVAAKKAAEEEKAKTALIESRFGLTEEKVDSSTTSDKQTRIINGDYGVIGAAELTPTSVYDNGEQTAITFAPNNPVPSIFYEEADGSESVVPFHFENDIMIVHRVARKFVLRRGDAVACLINGSFNASGANTKTHTISDDIVREVKEIK